MASIPSSPKTSQPQGSHVGSREAALQISFPWKLEELLEVCTELCSQAWAPRSLRTRARGASWATRQARGGRAAPLLSGESSFTRRRIGMLLFQILLLLLKIQRGRLTLSEAMARSETHANVQESLEGLHTPTSEWLPGRVGKSTRAASGTWARLPQAIQCLVLGGSLTLRRKYIYIYI